MKAAPLYELFSSVQGEGTRVGERHLFVRFAGCDLACAYCDTPASRRIPAAARVFFPKGAQELANPVPHEVLDRCVRRLERAAGPHHAVALTGGEPLLFADYLLPLARGWRASGMAVLLETGGHRPQDLARLIDEIDIVVADIKLASTAGKAADPAVAGAFLALAARRECTVKLVVNQRTTPAEVVRAATLVEARAPEAPLILQPVSGARFGPPPGPLLLALQQAALSIHRATRIIPQTHRLLHLR